jgi:hypothetical protein
MLQQLIALIVIVFFLGRLIWQRRNKTIASGEFIFWLFFWLAAGLAIISLKAIDRLAAGLGFSGSGIQILLYVAVAILFYLIFRLRLRLAKMEQDLTKIVTRLAINEQKK